jgi:hypothetical protein
MNYTIEHIFKEKVDFEPEHLFIEDFDDMLALEKWEDKLEAANIEYVTVFRKVEGRFLYSIFANYRKKGSPFK